MFIIKILCVGRVKETWLEEAMAEYVRRLSPVAKIETVWVGEDVQLLRLVAKERQIICLDPQGQQLDSLAFASLIQAKLIEGGSRLTFVIGGPDGLPHDLRAGPWTRVSLSSLTFTHQLARLILAEQLYRSFEILRGSPYHR